MILADSHNLPPLADRIRPTRLEQVVGQAELLGAGKPLRRLIEAGRIHSMIFQGPPGAGKTTLARMMATYVDAHWIVLSAVQSGVKDIRQAVAEAQAQAKTGRKTVVFVDEVHRFNKAQQDAFLPYIEDATIVFIGATTENPSFELNAALLSRCRVFVMNAIQQPDLLELIERGILELQAGHPGLKVDTPVRELIAYLADGDARRALNLLEISVDALAEADLELGERQVLEAAGSRLQHYDKRGDRFYDQISAFHKSLRGSNPDAGLYWLARMLQGGCDPVYIARRLTVIASEDIGNADPRALSLAIDAWEAIRRLGQPEGELALAQATTYLASAPKSNAAYAGYKNAQADARESASAPVPLHLRNAVTALDKSFGVGKAYHYAHSHITGYSPGQRYFPDGMEEKPYYQPVDRGLESKISQRLEYLKQLDFSHDGVSPDNGD